ncbi:MAG TPA: DnaJ domain-containing protein [Vicinamibacteria bacterium]
MEKPKDYYRILGVPRDATLEVIKRAYRRLARKLHPDHSGEKGSEAFREVQAAYETLADAEQRRRYDEGLVKRERATFEPLSWSFVRSPAAGDLRRPTSPGSLSGEIVLSRAEALSGGVLPLQVPLAMSCPSCDGTGGFVFDCGRCDGEGRIDRRFPVPVHIPPNVREGTVFQVKVDDPAVISVLLTVHIRPV